LLSQPLIYHHTFQAHFTAHYQHQPSSPQPGTQPQLDKQLPLGSHPPQFQSHQHTGHQLLFKSQKSQDHFHHHSITPFHHTHQLLSLNHLHYQDHYQLLLYQSQLHSQSQPQLSHQLSMPHHHGTPQLLFQDQLLPHYQPLLMKPSSDHHQTLFFHGT